MPSSLVPLIAGSALPFVTLDELGWRAGQGLRTGANKFFYLRKVGTERAAHELLQPARELGDRTVDVPTEASAPVLQRQADLPDGYALRADNLDGRVLVLDDHVLPEDLKPLTDAPYAPMPPALAAHVRRAARVNVGTDDDPKYFPELSAVTTNVRSAAADRPARFWYQLPRFTDRHRPSLLLARINNGHPRTLINEDRLAIVDANFSTLWPTRQTAVNAHALLAILNSAWCSAVLELAGTVMGGGALKIEAAHMRRVPIPRLSEEIWARLAELGRQLAHGNSPQTTLDEVDMLIFQAMGFDDAARLRADIGTIATERLKARSA